jgi:hypothetical protein
LVGNLKGRGHLGDLDVDRRILLKQILKKWGVKLWAEFIWLRIVISGGLLWV